MQDANIKLKSKDNVRNIKIPLQNRKRSILLITLDMVKFVDNMAEFQK